MKFLFLGLLKKFVWSIGFYAALAYSFLMKSCGFMQNKKTDAFNKDTVDIFDGAFDVESNLPIATEKGLNLLEKPEENPENSDKEYDVITTEEIEKTKSEKIIQPTIPPTIPQKIEV